MTAFTTDNTRTWVLRILCGLAFALAALLLGTGAPAGATPASAPLDTATPTTATVTATRTSTPLPAETCGPNSNYTVTQSTAQLVPGTEDIGNHCLGCTTQIELPFPFTLYGQEFNHA